MTFYSGLTHESEWDSNKNVCPWPKMTAPRALFVSLVFWKYTIHFARAAFRVDTTVSIDSSWTG